MFRRKLPQYWWLLEPRPLTTSISQVDCCWWIYRWMHELLDERPMEHGVRQGRRCGFVFVEVSRYPYSRTEIEVQVIVTEVSATLDGTPLDDTGRPIR